jgi:hypothetical protein
MSRDHQRTRGSGGTFSIFRPFVSQKPARLAGERKSPMRVRISVSSGVSPSMSAKLR